MLFHVCPEELQYPATKTLILYVPEVAGQMPTSVGPVMLVGGEYEVLQYSS